MSRSSSEARGTGTPAHTLHPLDAGWLLLESSSNLMHGGILCVFDLPDGADGGFVDQLVEDMRHCTEPTSPFDRRLKHTGLARVIPQWELVERIDPDQHLERHALPAPGGDAELTALVSHLQSIALDHGRPLWSFHVIDGLAGSRFAVFGKMHHALADGVSALHMVDGWLSNQPTDRTEPAMWTVPPPKRRPKSGERPPVAPETSFSRQVRGLANESLKPVRLLMGATRATLKAATGVAARPWSAPRTAFNTPISAERTVVTQSFDLGRFQQLAKQAGGTVNDAVLTMCAGALRRYLSDIGTLPTKSLITNIPVSLRSRADSQGTSNAISWAMLPLATDIDDIRERFDTIRAAATKAKSELTAMGPDSINTYTLLVLAPILVEQLAKLGGRIPPMYNLPISNVPGPRQTKYLNGAPMRGIYALTVLYGGQSLNTVAVSYAGQLNFSFTACADELPNLQRLAPYCDDALTELEEAYGVRRTGPIDEPHPMVHQTNEPAKREDEL